MRRGKVILRERQVARELSAEIDRMLSEGAWAREDGSIGRPSADPLLEAARRLSRINECLPPVPEALERRVQAIVRSRAGGPLSSYRLPPWQWARSALGGALTAAILLLVLWIVTPGGQAAWAQMLQVLRLGQTRVVVTPTISLEQTRSVREPLRDLVDVELRIGRAPALPKTLPEGYTLQEIAAVSYPDLPAWISQPFYVELCYGVEGVPPSLCLREYRLLFREYGEISEKRFLDNTVTYFEQVEVGGVPGALLEFSGDEPKCAVIWERDGLLLELRSDGRDGSHPLSKEELLRIAQTVR